MKLLDIFEASAYYPQPKYLDKKILGSTKDWLAKLGVDKKDITPAIRKFEDTNVFKDLEERFGPYSSSSTEESLGTLRFGKAASGVSYKIYATGQIRNDLPDGPGSHVRLNSPNPMNSYVKGDPVKTLLNIYIEAGKELLSKNTRAEKPKTTVSQWRKDTMRVENFKGSSVKDEVASAGPEVTSLALKNLPAVVKLDGDLDQFVRVSLTHLPKLQDVSALSPRLEVLVIHDCKELGLRQLTKFKELYSIAIGDEMIRTGVLNLLLVSKLNRIENLGRHKVVQILNDAIKQYPHDPRKRVMWAQAELINQLGEPGKALAQL